MSKNVILTVAGTVFLGRTLTTFMPNINGKILVAVFGLFIFFNVAALGEINVYFNQSVDHSYAYNGNEAEGDCDFAQILYNRINNAQCSIDMAVYSFDLNVYPYPLSNAIIDAYNRGVIVRVVYDNRSIQNGIQYLINAGIPVLQRTDNEGLMHNKFYIFDARNSSTDDDWVVTGSWNATISGTWNNYQNIVEIQNADLAEAYTTEFQEMWGSTGNYPNASNARFGNNKYDNTPHLFLIDGVEVELYFSPSDNTTSHIIQQIQSAQNSVCFALLAFTRYDIANALQVQSISGAEIYGIIDDANATGSQWSYLTTFAQVYEWNQGAIFHHKYAFFDYDAPSSAPAVLTGSHNWSNAAENNNDENTLIIKSADIVNQYVQEFAARMSDLGAVLPPPFIPAVENLSIELVQNSIGLSWDEVPEATSYNVYASYDPYTPMDEWTLLGNTAIPFFMDDEALLEDVKFYRVTAID